MNDFNFKKKYGQNFLNSDTAIEKIVNSISPAVNDLIIEIGPGAGALTKKLKKYNAKITAFEIDDETYKYLDNLVDDRTEIIYDDFLTADIKKIVDEIPHEKLFIIGNLPYYITTPIIKRIIGLNLNPEVLTVMVQKEVGERFLATPGNKEYSYITVLLHYYFNIEKVTDVNRKSFYPIPNVDSMVIRMTKKPLKKVDLNKFTSLLKDSFQFKRKTIANNLKKYDREKVSEILTKYGKDLNSRAEELSLDIFIDLANNI